MIRGEVWWADFGLPFGSEPGFQRPVLVVQDDGFNRSRIQTVVVVPFSTNLALGEAPGNVLFEAQESGLPKASVAVTSQITALDRQRLITQVAPIAPRCLREIEDGVRLVLGL